MRPYFVGQPVPSLVFGCTILVWMAIEVRQALRRRPEGVSADRGSLLILRVWIALGVVAASVAAARVPEATFDQRNLLSATGIVIMWCGIGLRWWSFRTLGRYFTFSVMTSPDQPVITGGPYRFVRHPSYTGILLVLAGIGMTYGNWLGLLALMLVPLMGFVYRIRVEEAALSRTLGSAYTSYAAGRKRLVPFIW